jgi:quinoprotein glucose dehydrogenase
MPDCSLDWLGLCCLQIKLPLSSLVTPAFRRSTIRVSVPSSQRCVLAVLCVLICAIAGACSRQVDTALFDAAEKPSADATREWRNYLGDKGFSHYSTLKQIDVSNVVQLQEAWRYDAGGAAANGSTQIQCSPLVVRGILYCTSPLLHAFALDASSGQELWRFDPDPDFSLVPNQNRGVAFWEASQEGNAGTDQRILYTAGFYLYALDARSGLPVATFGDDGKVDLRTGLAEQWQDAAVVATTPGSIYKNLFIVGSRVSEMRGAAPGDIRAFDIVTGELRWVFHTIPRPGEFGVETWPQDSWAQAGGANSWAGIAIDEERGLAFAPTGSATFDFYGNDRHGDNLFANSLVALDANTGERVWHYQFVRHDLWDKDLPSPPNLITIERDGELIPAVSQATKTGHLFVFHRETGEPLFPIEEVPVVGEGVVGEQAATSQPLPLAPPPFAAQEFVPTDRTPQMASAVKARIEALDYGGQFIVPSTRGLVLYPGMDGGAEWGGAAYDEQHQRLYINSNEVPYLLQLTAVEKDEGLSPKFAYLMLCAGCHGADMHGDGVSVPGLWDLYYRLSPMESYNIVKQGRGRMPAFQERAWYEIAVVLWYIYTADPEDAEASGRDANPIAGGGDFLNAGFQKLVDPLGLPASKPPWGTLTAIDMKSADILWRIPFGDYPQMLEQGESGLGSENYGGPLATAGDLLFIAATPDRLFKAYNKHTGALLWQSELPAAGFATPITYEVDGRQYVVVAAGGGKLGQPSGGHYVSYALPEAK